MDPSKNLLLGKVISSIFFPKYLSIKISTSHVRVFLYSDLQGINAAFLFFVSKLIDLLDTVSENDSNNFYPIRFTRVGKLRLLSNKLLHIEQSEAR